ncbi:MAG TPA: ribose-phosphate pyrophosphokinase [Acidobacteriota bacterium]|nr:ribose-phosphate pyrophosphokinase [Acidobacteriota bacterium]
MGELKLFSGNANPELAEQIGQHLGIGLGAVKLERFSDEEVNFQILENVRGTDAFIVQPTGPPSDRNLMELLIMIDAFKRASAQRITAVIPYYGYARQDRKDKPRVPISSRLVADLLSAAGVHRCLFMDLHAGQIQGFFNLPVDHLYAKPVVIDYLKSLEMSHLTVVSPDAGGVERARSFAKQLGARLAIIDKRRPEANEADVMHIVGDVSGRNVIIIDDIIDTAGTLCKATAALKEQGAERILAAVTHPVLSGPAMERLEQSAFEKVIVTNTLHLTREKRDSNKIKVLSVAGLLGEAIQSIHEETSVSKLFI